MKIRLKRPLGMEFSVITVLLLTVFLTLFFSIFILARIKPVFEEKTLNAARIKATAVLNSAINNVFAETEYTDYTKIIYGENGGVNSLSADTVKMNQLKAEVMSEIRDYIKEGSTVIHIPIGSLTNYPVFQGIGYRIPVKISLEGIPKLDFKSVFENSGINQVRHKIFLEATAEFNAVSSAMTISEKVSTEIPVSETVIVGDVPQYYGKDLSVVGR